jgi:hypothetical protein
MATPSLVPTPSLATEFVTCNHSMPRTAPRTSKLRTSTFGFLLSHSRTELADPPGLASKLANLLACSGSGKRLDTALVCHCSDAPAVRADEGSFGGAFCVGPGVLRSYSRMTLLLAEASSCWPVGRKARLLTCSEGQ